MNIIEFEHNDDAVIHLASSIGKDLEAAIMSQDHASLLVSGGKSPIALFDRLSQLPLDWHKVTISLVDDRWVDANHSDSNELLVCTHLLRNLASAATFIPLVGGQSDAHAGLDDAMQRVKSLSNGADVMVLGMGVDGHTASIFPCCAQVATAMAADNKQQLIVTSPTSAPYQRIGVTLNQIIAAKKVYLPLVGSAKVAVFEQACEIENYQTMPIGAVIAQHAALEVLISQTA